MQEKNFASFGDRLREERIRIDMQQLELADACSVSRRTLSAWENGEATPNAPALAVMAGVGFDVLYVVTGQRASESEATLAPAERALLQAWRDGGDKGRAALAAVAQVLRPDS
ncbi:helix-turn-helix domain-containing protein [Comamonas aquatica]|uniref:helix-turn-helix domain-containing protein n=1 Tax=Comamonas aquatica TaxID=225991 RepID=UPI0024495AC2|nr:helix-turn-helix transcriptional regulator [Comamonas aquatica]MDH0200822.1 helix-turn-helix domain-containing protein [Comamonas aquatica]